MRWFLLLALAALLVSCDTAPVAPAPTAPAPGATQGSGATPQAGYPAPQEKLPQGPKFTLKIPVKASDAQVTGSGMAGVPLKLVDMTSNGDTLATTTIGGDGSFTFDVGGKLTAGNRIGLVLGETAGTKFDRNDFIRGPGYMDTAFIGIVFASTEVEP